MSSHKKSSKHKSTRVSDYKRTPRTMRLEENQQSQFPALIPESFNLSALKNIDLVGKIDEMRSLTKELSIMARQLEQWMSVAHTIGMAFKDNGILRDVVKAVANVGSAPAAGATGGTSTGSKAKQGNKPKESRRPVPPPFPFPFFQNSNNEFEDDGEVEESRGNRPSNEPINFMEILTNPAFQEIVSKLFLQKK